MHVDEMVTDIGRSLRLLSLKSSKEGAHTPREGASIPVLWSGWAKEMMAIRACGSRWLCQYGNKAFSVVYVTMGAAVLYTALWWDQSYESLADASVTLVSVLFPTICIIMLFYSKVAIGTSRPESMQYRAECPRTYSIATFVGFRMLRDSLLAVAMVAVMLPAFHLSGLTAKSLEAERMIGLACTMTIMVSAWRAAGAVRAKTCMHSPLPPLSSPTSLNSHPCV